MILETEVTSFVRMVDLAYEQQQHSNIPGVSGEPNTSYHSLRNVVWDHIRALICVEGGMQISQLKELSKALLRRALLDPSYKIYSDALRHLLYGAHTDWTFRSFSEEQTWAEALRLLREVRQLDPTSFNADSYLGWERDIAFTKAVKQLQDRGYSFNIEGGQITFADGELKRCCESLENNFELLGGHRVLFRVFKHFQSTGKFTRGRYMIHRPSRPLTGSASISSPPIGYITNLAAKYLHIEKTPSNCEEIVESIFELATNIVAALDLETHSPYSHIFNDHKHLPRYIQELIVADHVFLVRQVSARDAIEMIESLFTWVPNEILQEKLGWTISNALALARRVLICPPEDGVNVLLRREDLLDVDLSDPILEKMLPYFVHDANAVNRSYLTPLDSNHVNVDLKPLIAQPSGRFMRVVPSISALGFYESITDALRKTLPKVEESIGTCIESTIAMAFKRRGLHPAVVSTKYSMDGVSGDCDAAIETTDTIILIEAKKKSITRVAQTGNALRAFLDLFDGLLHAQLQLGRQELLLRKNGFINFKDGSRLSVNGRRIERFVVTLLDWGGTQDRRVIQQLAQILIGSELKSSPADKIEEQKLFKANATLKELYDQSQSLIKLGLDPACLSSNWWFISMPQLLFALDEMKSSDDLYARLKLIRNTTIGTLDFYSELNHWDSITRQLKPS